METQIFNDGNKRTAIIFANHYLVAHGAGLMVVPQIYIRRSPLKICIAEVKEKDL